MVSRGSKKPSPYPTTTFIGLRILDPILQYSILANSTLSPVLVTINLPPHAYIAPTLTISNVSTNLTPHGLILLLMATGSSLKQIYWVGAVSEEEMLWNAAVGVPVFNTVLNTVNTLLSTTQLLSCDHYYDPHLGVVEQLGQVLSVPRIAVGVSLYVLGMGIETVAEVQRRNFKRKAENKGKVFKGGLFQLARHINYGGYTLWRTGFAIAGGGWIWGATVFGWFAGDFSSRAVPVLDEYCEEKYGDQWKAYKSEVGYKLFPGIY